MCLVLLINMSLMLQITDIPTMYLKSITQKKLDGLFSEQKIN